MKTVKVKAADGLLFPFEDNPHRYIAAETVEVPSNTYYQRAIADGDLVLVSTAKAKTKGAN